MNELQQFLIYQSEDDSTRIDVMLEAETPWLNQKQLTELFGKAKGTNSEHIKHIFEDGEPLRQLFGYSEQLNLKAYELAANDCNGSLAAV